MIIIYSGMQDGGHMPEVSASLPVKVGIQLKTQNSCFWSIF